MGKTASGATRFTFNPAILKKGVPRSAVVADAGNSPALTGSLQSAIYNPGQSVQPEMDALQARGGSEVLESPTLQAAAPDLESEEMAEGFEIGVGIMQQVGITPEAIEFARDQLTPDQQRGFDLAIIAKIGEQTAEAATNPRQQFLNNVAEGKRVGLWERFTNWLKRPYLGKRIGVG